MPLKEFKEGDVVIYNDRSYFFDRYLPDYKVEILLIEDDDIDLLNMNDKCFKSYIVSLKYVEKSNKG